MQQKIIQGNILTMDPERPRAEAFSVIGDRIGHVGTLAEVSAACAPGTSVERAPGAVVLPGLIDTHNHMLSTGIQKRLVDLSACNSIEDMLAAVADFAQRHPDKAWITSGTGWQIDHFPDPRYPTRQELDAVCPDRPVALNRGGHVIVANSRALEIGGVTRDTPDPEGGRVVKGADGEPTGVLFELPAMVLVEHHIPDVSREDRLAALRDVQKLYHAAGLTGVIDPGLTNDDLSIYQELQMAGELSLRTVAMPLAQTADDPEVLMANLKAWGVRTGFGNERLKLGGIKVFMDGGGSLGTALMREPYPDMRCNCGIQVTHTATFHRIVEFCAQSGWSLGVHAVGGKAIDIVLQVMAEVNERHPIRDLRFHIIHAYLWPSAENIETAKRLGVSVATQPTMQYNFAPLLVRRFGADAFGKATPIRSWLDGGVKVGGGSDSPVNDYPPLLGIWHAVTRYVDKIDETIGAQEAVSVDEALRMYTRDAAWIAFSEKERGMIRPGLLADWVALSEDPYACEPLRLRDIRVERTVVGGETVYEAA